MYMFHHVMFAILIFWLRKVSYSCAGKFHRYASADKVVHLITILDKILGILTSKDANDPNILFLRSYLVSLVK